MSIYTQTTIRTTARIIETGREGRGHIHLFVVSGKYHFLR